MEAFLFEKGLLILCILVRNSNIYKMISFFRKLRRQLINNGKTSNYLKYAIGEIALVVVGILIALQINNWNHDRQDKISELNFYSNFKEQLAEDIYEIKGNIIYNNNYMEQFEYAVQIIESNDRSRIDSLSQISISLTKYSDLGRQSNIYETLVNSGQVKLLNNTDIIEEIRRLEELYIYINKMEEIHREVILKEVATSLRDNFKLLTLEAIDADNIYTVNFQNLIIFILGIMKEKDEIYHEALVEIQTIIKYIDEEIDN